MDGERPEILLASRLCGLVAGCGAACAAVLMSGVVHRLDMAPVEWLVSGLAWLAALGLGERVDRLCAAAGLRRIGTRPRVLGASIGSTLLLPVLAFAPSAASATAALVLSGLCAGILDAAMTAAMTEDPGARADADGRTRPARRPSGLFRQSCGIGAAGGALTTLLLLAAGFEPPLVAALLAAPMGVATLVIWPYLPEAV